MIDINSVDRFARCVDDYAKFRPAYPDAAVDYILRGTGVGREATVADIGAGTGKLSRLLLERGLRVIAVEPGDDMRAAADLELSRFANYRSVPATAERTTLPDSSVDAITVAQALHWFDMEKCKPEFARILRPGGRIAVVYNRRDNSSPFMAKYQELMYQWCAEMPNETHDKITDGFYHEFLGGFEREKFANAQLLNFAGLMGRARSSSYAPPPDHPNYAPLESALRRLYGEYQQDGVISFDYVTEVVIGQVNPK